MTMNPPSAFPADGGPARSSWNGDTQHDVNPACGHHLRAACAGCGVCTSCDGCYCAELREEAYLIAQSRQETETHLKHTEHHDDCPCCARDKKETDCYTRCPTCGLAYPDGFGDHGTHNPPLCRPLPPYRLGVDWGYLRGQNVTLVWTNYEITGYVLLDQPAPDPRAYRPHLRMRRTSPYADRLDESTPFNPREWMEVRPAPPSRP